MTLSSVLFPTVAAFAVSLALTWATLLALRRSRFLDVPNARSSHTNPVPRGGGIGFVLVILGAWTAMSLSGEADLPLAMLAGATAVAAISLADDRASVSLRWRLAVQTAAVALALVVLPVDGPVLWDGLPVFVDRAIIGLIWLWFLNLFNFMDGINGVASIEAIAITFGIAAIAVVTGRGGWPVTPALVAGAAVAGFLPFNLPRARMFMGDVGSVTLGYLVGWLLILVAAEGGLATAILLGLYFVADATSTLIYRAAIGEPVSKPHRRHAYQRAVDRGLTHAAVTGQVAIVGLVLAILGALALAWPVPAVAAGLVVVGGFILWLRHGALRIAPPPSSNLPGES